METVRIDLSLAKISSSATNYTSLGFISTKSSFLNNCIYAPHSVLGEVDKSFGLIFSGTFKVYGSVQVDLTQKIVDPCVISVEVSFSQGKITFYKNSAVLGIPQHLNLLKDTHETFQFGVTVTDSAEFSILGAVSQSN